MKKIRQAIAILIAVALLIEPCIAAGNVKEVQAADNTSSVYEQMKVTDISFQVEDGQDKDALEVGDAGVKIVTDVVVNVPDGWAVSDVEVEWYGMKDADIIGVNYAYANRKFDVSSQPEDHVYTVEHNVHKYVKEDVYLLTSIFIEFVEVGNEKNCCWLWGESYDWGKMASANNPIEFEWEVETEDDYIELPSTKYYGAVDYTILKAGGKDTTIPKLNAVKIKTTGTLNKSIPTEIDVTFTEKGSGVKSIGIIGASEEGEDYLTFETDAMEKYTGKQTVTLKSNAETMELRTSGKYHVYALGIEDFAGNSVTYYADDKGYLVAYTYDENDDGSTDENTHRVKGLKYNVCDGHVYKNSVTKATTSANGSIVKKCKYCDAVKTGSKTTISRIKNVKLSRTSYVYDGKVKKPTISVYDANGKKIASTNYTVTYPSGCKLAGEYKVKIVFKNNYKGTVYKTYTIKPKGTSIASTSTGTKKFTVKWKKQATQTTGYQIRYSTSSSFKTYSSKVVSGKNTTSTTIKNLKAGKKYYVKVRTYKTVKVNGKNKKVYSAWSGVKTVKTK